MNQSSPPLNYRPADASSLGAFGVFTQTLAIFIDAYRELQSRRLFWITLGLSFLVVAAFAVVGFNATGITIFGKQFNNQLLNTAVIPLDELYKLMFVNLGVQFWLAWFAIILALVSCAPIFPEFVSNGAVDLYLARPLGRTRLFLTKYLAGLLFTALQVLAFCVASFLVIGLRGGVWVPGIFLAVPLVTLVFSYLWCVCALLGLVTRSTIASLLLTLLFWLACFGVHTTEGALLFYKIGREVEDRDLARQVDLYERNIARLTTRPAASQSGTPEFAQVRVAQASLDGARKRQSERAAAFDVGRWHRIAYVAHLPLPKVAATSALAERVLTDSFREPPERRRRRGDEEDEDAQNTAVQVRGFTANSRLEREAAIETTKAMRARTSTSIVGSSLLFEAVVLGLAAFYFSRKDF